MDDLRAQLLDLLEEFHPEKARKELNEAAFWDFRRKGFIDGVEISREVFRYRILEILEGPHD